VIRDDRGVRLSYDVEHWGKKCCCPDRASPVDCCSFITLGRLGLTWSCEPSAEWRLRTNKESPADKPLGSQVILGRRDASRLFDQILVKFPLVAIGLSS
jgi:hypothetical protein